MIGQPTFTELDQMGMQSKITSSVKKQPLKTIDMFPEEYSKRNRPPQLKTQRQYLKPDRDYGFNFNESEPEDIVGVMQELEESPKQLPSYPIKSPA